MTKDDALKLALDALEGVHQDPKGWWNCHVEITAIKEALAQPEQEQDEDYDALSQKQLASIKRDTRVSFEDAAVRAIAAMTTPEQREISCVYKATTKKGETAHFGEYSAAKAWAGWGSVERIPLTTLTLVEKTKKTCGTCEALARTVMLDQTSHDRHKREWVGLTGDDMDDITLVCIDKVDAMLLTEAKLKEKNT